jgi:hypothetical protein
MAGKSTMSSEKFSAVCTTMPGDDDTAPSE